MKLSALLQPLIDAKAPHELIMAQIVAFEAQQEAAIDKRRQTDASRQARKREADKSRDITLRHSDTLLAGTGDARVEDKTLPLENNKQNQENKKDALRDVEEFKAVLSPHVNADQLASLLKVRRQRRGVINGHAARLFLGAVERCGISVSEAADKCISRGWLSIEPDWIKPSVRGSPPAPKPTLAAAFGQLTTEIRRRNETGLGTGDGGVQPPLLDLPAIRHG